LARVAGVLRRGEIIMLDYVVDAAVLIERGAPGADGAAPRWMRTYRAHDRGGDPLDALGRQDITCDVPAEYLYAAARRAGFVVAADTSQAEWLRQLGLDGLVAEGAARWREGAHRGDLAAIAGRSRVHEGDALTDPGGLGAHRVVVLARG
jgi:SAM-dependent MidA family methyltransferase